MPNTRYNKMLGLGKYQPQTKWVCFLPWVSEFGWYIMNHVKRVHGYNHANKIVCIKRGHECLFPTASDFWYHWADDVPDKSKGGVVAYKHNNRIKKWVTAQYGNDVTFVNPSDTGWPEKTSLAPHTFVPKPLKSHDFDIDVIIAPRLRQIDPHRNYPAEWQGIADFLTSAGLKVAICGAKHISVPIKGMRYHSWDYIDIDTDVEMILKSKIVITQDSGLAYLTMMCKKPLIIIDFCHTNVVNKHRDHSVYFNHILKAWGSKELLLKEVQSVIQKSVQMP
jgi:hypothetical protein